jgi:NitT/TauT family transport system permease protein
MATQAIEPARRATVGPIAAAASAPGLAGVLRSKGLSAGRIRLLLVVLLLALWEFAPASKATKFWLSSPSMILSTLWGWIAEGSLWAHLGASLSVMITGYALGCIAGIGLGFLFGFLPRVHRVLSPYVAAFYALPKIALAPLFIILFGIDMASKVALVSITVFFLLLNNTIDGVKDVDRDLVQTLKLMGASATEIVRKVLIPSALPWILTGMRISVRYAFTATLLAELIAANRGLGFLIEYNSGNFNATGSYAAIAVLVVFSVTLSELLTRIQTYTSRWRVASA